MKFTMSLDLDSLSDKEIEELKADIEEYASGRKNKSRYELAELFCEIYNELKKDGEFKLTIAKKCSCCNRPVFFDIFTASNEMKLSNFKIK